MGRRLWQLLTGVVLAAFLAPPGAADKDSVKRGEYLSRIMDCGGCHTPGILEGKPDQARYLAGSEIGFHVPGHGVSYPPNLTPDEETGLGDWSVEEIMRAVRQGKRPDGRVLAPPMPWPTYANLTDEDARALAMYLKSLEPVKHATPARVDSPEKAVHPFLAIQSPE